MTRWRLAVAAMLILVMGVPLSQPLGSLLNQGTLLRAWTDVEGFVDLAANTLILIAGTLSLAMPIGTATAVLLFRTDLPWRKPLQLLTVVALFIPLPLLVSAWQAALGSGGWLPVVLWENRPGQRWTEGLGPAIWIHALAAMPWVILLVGQGLCWVETELEEEALLSAGPWRVLWLVTLPRCRATLLAAALWITLQTAGEITVVDMMRVPTLAGEVHTQFVLGQGLSGLAQVLPAVLAIWLILVWLLPRLEKALPPLATLRPMPRLIRLGPARWPCWLGLVGLIGFLAWIPLVSLVWKTGLSGAPRTWTPGYAWQKFAEQFQQYGGKVGQSMMWAALAGMLAASLALVCCWSAEKSRWFRGGLLTLAVVAWVYPGPATGIGLKETIQWLVDPTKKDSRKDPTQEVEQAERLPPGILVTILYENRYSPVPVVWAHVLRFFPFALGLLWSVVRMVPRELREMARLEGARPWQDLVQVTWPLAWRAWAWTSIAVAALALGEVAASNRVEIPGADTFAKLVFDRMHNGVENDVASLCLVLLTEMVLVAVLTLGGIWCLGFAHGKISRTRETPAS